MTIGQWMHESFFFQNTLNVLANWADGPNKLVVLSQQDLTMADFFYETLQKRTVSIACL